jgi:hypothetical protein
MCLRPAAAQYFSVQHLGPRVKILERSDVPKAHVVGWVYVSDEGGVEMPLGERLMEFAPDTELHECRADDMRYMPTCLSAASAAEDLSPAPVKADQQRPA